MKEALKEANKAFLEDEIPVGCVIVRKDKIIARGHNKREAKNLVISHAEIEAITKANKALNSWRLSDCDIYITMEPCVMCGGAIIQARFKNVFYGAKDPKAGAFNIEFNILDNNNFNYYPLIHPGILEEECSEIIKNYFSKKRKLY